LKVPLSLTSAGLIEGAQLLGHQLQSRKRAIFLHSSVQYSLIIVFFVNQNNLNFGRNVTVERERTPNVTLTAKGRAQAEQMKEGAAEGFLTTDTEVELGPILFFYCFFSFFIFSSSRAN
jgi:hypothetical protein